MQPLSLAGVSALLNLLSACCLFSSHAYASPGIVRAHAQIHTQLHVDSCGSPTNLKGRANGAIVEIIVDADAGTVQFRLTRNCTVPGSSYTIINRSPVVTAISGLPRGVQLRPWCRLFDVPDRVTMSGFWSHA